MQNGCVWFLPFFFFINANFFFFSLFLCFILFYLHFREGTWPAGSTRCVNSCSGDVDLWNHAGGQTAAWKWPSLAQWPLAVWRSPGSPTLTDRQPISRSPTLSTLTFIKSRQTSSRDTSSTRPTTSGGTPSTRPPRPTPRVEGRTRPLPTRSSTTLPTGLDIWDNSIAFNIRKLFF